MTSSERLPVVTDLPEYRVAVAELPVSARLSTRASGAVVVVGGTGTWWRAVRDAASAGARAVVVAEPGDAPVEQADALRELGIPVIVSRARLRPDVAADARDARRDTAARAVSIDAAAGSGAVGAVVRDALGWARVMGGSRLELRAARSTGSGVSVLLDAHSVPCTVGLGVLAHESTGDLLRVTVMGEVISEVVVDSAQLLATVVTATDAGRLHAPPRYESAQRLAVRRALAAARDSTLIGDLDDLVHDAGLAASILARA